MSLRAASPDGADGRRLPSAYLTPGSASFSDFLSSHAPHLLPGSRPVPPGLSGPNDLPHGTTIVTVRFGHGVVMAGDRRSTMGNLIAARDLDKVFVADDYSVVGIAGTAGIAVELVKLLQVELEHYEKIEGTAMSLEGKANRLAAMIRGNMALALSGLAVVPVFAGVDLRGGPIHGVHAPRARIFSFDVAGGCYEEKDHHSVGSGAVFSRGALKKLWHADLTETDAVRVAVDALYDAADDDSATGGPDVGRRIWPTCVVVDPAGARRLLDSTMADVVTAVLQAREGNPGGAR